MENYNKIEILSPGLLDSQRSLVNELKQSARLYKLEFGWHYLLDLAWILNELGEIQGKRIMDAGAGRGVIQWHMAILGAEVISVDRDSRVALPLSFRIHAPVTGMRSQDLLPAGQIFRDELLHPCSGSWRARLRAVRDYAKYWYSGAGKRNIGAGRVLIYNEDLTRLAEIADDSLDAVVAVSSLEHNAPERLPLVVNEIMRVLKPGGLLLATLGAARDQDWWHVPSSGWNYTETSLRRLFELPLDTPSNYTEFDQIFASLRDCAELRDNLAGFYFQSGQNGMPWGKWDPQYQSVGVRKQKLLRTVSSKL